MGGHDVKAAGKSSQAKQMQALCMHRVAEACARSIWQGFAMLHSIELNTI